MIGRQDAGAHERVRHRDAAELGQAAHRAGCPPRAATGQQERSLRAPQFLGDGPRGRAIQRRPRHRRGRHDLRIKGLGEDIHRDRDEDRARPAGESGVPGSGHDPRHLVGSTHPPAPLHEGLIDRDLVGVATEVELLVRPTALVIGGHVAGDDE